MSWIKFLLVQMNTNILYLKQIYTYQSKRKILSQLVFLKIYFFEILKKQNFCLPRLEIDKFDIDVINWSRFWDKYSSLIHKSDSPVKSINLHI